MLVHGLLHLAGWDHERGPEDHEAMAAEERAVLRELGWPVGRAARAGCYTDTAPRCSPVRQGVLVWPLGAQLTGGPHPARPARC